MLFQKYALGPCMISEIMDVRLIGPSKNVGRVEVLYGNTWVPVCQETIAKAPNTDNPWTDLAASVACKQLGYEAGGVALPKYGENKGLSSLTGYRVNDVICEDGEFRLQSNIISENCEFICEYEKQWSSLYH